ncbi:MAG: hypothetical protein Q8P68_05450 [Candidatus Peregrinibacteria bacterium]|nr:hypothetical protein [Candidatus Peregrinibacteria bacterium]MDZ4244363.1 hypothetical protein [Candidatus Gracilibacteria bacterium]
MAKKIGKFKKLLLPLSAVIIISLYTVNYIAFADFSTPISRSTTNKKYDEVNLNKGNIDKIQFFKIEKKAAAGQDPSSLIGKSTEKPKPKTPFAAIFGIIGATAIVKKTADILKDEITYKIQNIPRTIYENVTKNVTKMVETTKQVSSTVYEAATRTVDKVIEVTKKVPEIVYNTVKETIIKPVVETYDKIVTKLKPVTEYVKQTFEKIVQVPRTIYDTVTRLVDKTVAVVKTVPYTVYETAKRTVNKVVEITKQVPRTIYKTVKEKVVRPVVETYQAAITKFKNVTEYVSKRIKESTQVARTIYENVTRYVNKTVKVVKQVPYTVYETVKQVVNRVSYVTKYIPKTIYSWIKSGWGWLKKKVTQYTKVVQKIITPVVTYVKRAITKFKNVTEYITTKVKQVISVPRTIYKTVTNYVNKLVPVVKQVAYTVYKKAKRIVDKVFTVTKQIPQTIYETVKEKIITPIVETYQQAVTKFKQVTEYVTEKVKQVIQVPKTIYESVVKFTEKLVPVIKQVAYDVTEKAERTVNKAFDITKQVASTIYKNVTEKIVTPIIETYQKAITKVQDIRQFIATKVKETSQVAKTIYDKVKVPVKVVTIAGITITNPALGVLMMPKQTREDIAIGTGKWALGLVEVLTSPQTLVTLSTLGENGIKLLGRLIITSSSFIPDKYNEQLISTFGFNKTELSSAQRLIPSDLHGPINPDWVKADNPTQLATMLGLDVTTLIIGIGEISLASKGARVAKVAEATKNSEGILNLIKNLFSKDAKILDSAEDVSQIITKPGKYKSLLSNDEVGRLYNLQKTSDGKIRYFVNNERRSIKTVDYILQDGKLKFGEKHSFISKGGNVDYAGTMNISKDGKSIESWDNMSGHYKPNASDIEGQSAVREAFKEQFGLELPEFSRVSF